MKLFRLILIAALFLLQYGALLSNNSGDNSDILFLSPVPSSKYVTKETNIIIRYTPDINFNTVSTKKFKIIGSQSGEHNFQIKRTDERNTIILKPDVSFWPGEDVTVEILKGISAVNSKAMASYKFGFTISKEQITAASELRLPYAEEYKNQKGNYTYNMSAVSPVIEPKLIPTDFPKITVLARNKPDQGYTFLSNIGFAAYTPPYLMVLDNFGYPVLYRKMPSACTDFKVINSSTFAYYDVLAGKYYSTNTSFTIQDSFYCGNGYSTDLHELVLLPNYHSYLMSYDSQHVDMSKIIPGGDSNAVVSGLIIQELDENKNVIFQWRSWDHFQITDTYENIYGHNIDYVHGNAIDLDSDGNIVISSRHLSEITKINRQTGNVIWRWGGKNNQFTFTNDTSRFWYQHAIRRLANGNFILFDNGNFHVPHYSRAVEYSLNIPQKTATKVWQYRNNPDIYSYAMGNAQRLASGNTLIGWGSANPTVIEATKDGNKVFELTFDMGIVSYRAYKFMWDGALPQIPSVITLEQNFPNPFNPITTIRFGIPEDGYVVLKVYDILGREVKTLIHDNLEAGRYNIDFYSQNFASGVYFYTLNANGLTDTKKMIFVK